MLVAIVGNMYIYLCTGMQTTAVYFGRSQRAVGYRLAGGNDEGGDIVCVVCPAYIGRGPKHLPLIPFPISHGCGRLSLAQ